MSDRVIELLLKARDETSTALRSMRSNVDSTTKSTIGLGDALKGVGVYLGTREIMQYVGETVKFAGELTDLSVKTRISSETLSAWGYAADQSGTSLENLANGVKFLRRNLYEASQGTKEAVDSLTALGLKVDDFNGKSTEKVVTLITKRLSELSSETDRTAIAMRLFGRGGDALLMLGDQFEALTDKAKRLGITIDDDTAQAMDELGDKLDEVHARSRSLTAEFMTHLAPTLMDVAEGLMRVLSSDFSHTQIDAQRQQLPSPMGADNSWWHNPQRIGRGAPGGNYVSNPLWYLEYTGEVESRETQSPRPPRPNASQMGLPTGPQSELYTPYEDSSTDWDVTELGIPTDLQSLANRYMDKATGQVDVSGMIAEARREAKELEGNILSVSDRMATSAEEADDIRKALERARNEGAEQLAQGMMQFFSIVSGGNAQWAQDLQSIYQLYKTIASIAQAFRLLSTVSSDITGITSAAANTVTAPSVVSPRAATTVNMIIANPQSRSDALDLGRRTAEAVVEYDRRFM